MADKTPSQDKAIFPTAEAFTEAAEKYFAECDATDELYTIPGLQLGLKKYGAKHRMVSRNTLQDWFSGNTCAWLKEAVQDACVRIEHQIETDPRYYENKGLATRAIFLLKQVMLGGLTDRETKEKEKVEVVIRTGKTIEESDFQ